MARRHGAPTGHAGAAKSIPGRNFIAQFRFDAATGRLHPNGTMRPKEPIEPRHYCFHPTLDVVHFSDEQGCTAVVAVPLGR